MLPRRSRWRAALAAVAALALLPSMAAAAPAPRDPRILGFDGIEYPSAPLVMEGTEGELYHGFEYDYACAWGGEMFEKGMRRLGALAKVIERSGRRAVFTVAPGKTDLVRQHMPRTQLPQGSCDSRGLRAQRRVLQHYRDPHYVSARNAVAAEPRPTYWKTDNHWNEIGVSAVARALAAHLDPRLAHRQRYRDVTKTQLGFLNYLRGVDTLETQDTVEYAGRVRVHTAPGSVFPVGSQGSDISWRSRPARLTWPGRTLMLGDSFTVVGLDSFGPLFKRARFIWNNNANSDEFIAEAIADADTVVLEVFQFFLVGSPLGSSSLRKAVKRELRGS